VILTSGELIEYMEATAPEDWPAPRGYGYNGPAGERLKSWHIALVSEFLDRMAGGDHRPRIAATEQREVEDG
jgi:hypothetical protein